MALATIPTLAGFNAFVANTMQVPANIIAENTQQISDSFDVAVEIVLDAIASVSGSMYTIAVYNLAADTFINFGQDPAGKAFFVPLRKKLKIGEFAAGVVAATSDETTGTTLLNPEAMKTFMLSDLQTLKTPYGRAYLAIAQRYGTLWGIS